MAAMNINKEEFERMLSEGKPLLVDFWAPWCGYCRRIGPVYDQIAQEYADRLTVAKVNVDDFPQLAEAQHIELLPTLVLYLGGKAAGSVVAPPSKAALDGFIRETLAQEEGGSHE